MKLINSVEELNIHINEGNNEQTIYIGYEPRFHSMKQAFNDGLSNTEYIWDIILNNKDKNLANVYLDYKEDGILYDNTTLYCGTDLLKGSDVIANFEYDTLGLFKMNYTDKSYCINNYGNIESLIINNNINIIKDGIIKYIISNNNIYDYNTGKVYNYHNFIKDILNGLT